MIPVESPAGRYWKLRVEVYENTTSLNLDLDDASLVQQPLVADPGPQ